MAIRVLIADDTEVMRAAIARTLKADPALEVVGEASSFAETVKQVSTLNPDIVLLDLHMPDEHRYLPEIVKGPLLETAGVFWPYPCGTMRMPKRWLKISER